MKKFKDITTSNSDETSVVPYIEQQSEMHKICLLIWDVNTKFFSIACYVIFNSFDDYSPIIHQQMVIPSLSNSKI